VTERELRNAEVAYQAAAAVAERARMARNDAVRAALECGYSQASIGRVLGLTGSRVQQLAAAAGRAFAVCAK